MLFLYFRVQKRYRKTARELKRLSSTARSPIFQHFNETINGLITVRAFEDTARFQRKSNHNTDFFASHLVPSYYWTLARSTPTSNGSNNPFSHGSCRHNFQMLDAGLAGLAINYSIVATQCLQGFISNYTELELKMNGIERVKYYTESKQRLLMKNILQI